eukprot:scaffold281241_cov55-Attheya_sp.AAC.1
MAPTSKQQAKPTPYPSKQKKQVDPNPYQMTLYPLRISKNTSTDSSFQSHRKLTQKKPPTKSPQICSPNT